MRSFGATTWVIMMLRDLRDVGQKRPEDTDQFSRDRSRIRTTRTEWLKQLVADVKLSLDIMRQTRTTHLANEATATLAANIRKIAVGNHPGTYTKMIRRGLVTKK
jgi:hypothetical protein